MKELTGKCREMFLKECKWYFRFLPEYVQNLMVIRWFNIRTKIWVDIQNWDGKYDFAVFDPGQDRVYMDVFDAGRRIKNYDEIQVRAIKKANEVFFRYYG